MFKIPVFTLGITVLLNVLDYASFPIRTLPVALLTLDRYLGTHFYATIWVAHDRDNINLIWAWGREKFTS